jgi:hypothetical protein
MNTAIKSDAVHFAMVHAVTVYDRRESTRRGYNRWAFAQYLQAIDGVEGLVNEGKSIRSAICECFIGRLAAAVLKSVGEPPLTDEEWKRVR